MRGILGKLLIGVSVAIMIALGIVVGTIQLPSKTQAEPRSDCDFRNTKWGDSVDDVRKYEEDSVEFYDIDKDGVLAASTTLNGYNVLVLYQFDNDNLFQCSYHLTSNYTSAGQYINVYNVLEEKLKEKYGTPVKSGIEPNEKESLIETAGEARALEYGFVTYYAGWKTDTTEIGMIMEAENYDIKLIIFYEDVSYVGSIDSGF